MWAEGFTATNVTVSGRDLGEVTLAPEQAEYRWAGMFPEAGLPPFSERIVPFTTGHQGPVVLEFSAGCSTRGTYEPLGIRVYAEGEVDPGRFVIGVNFGSQFPGTYSEEKVLPAARYYARLSVQNGDRGGCPWSMTIRYPR